MSTLRISSLCSRILNVYITLVEDTEALSRTLDEGCMSTRDLREGEAQLARLCALCDALIEAAAACRDAAAIAYHLDSAERTLNYLSLAGHVADIECAISRDLEQCTPILHNEWENGSDTERAELEAQFTIHGRMAELAQLLDEVWSALVALDYEERMNAPENQPDFDPGLTLPSGERV